MKPRTPLTPGKYWYDTLYLPAGVVPEIVVMDDGSAGVRFCFTTIEQAEQLARDATSFAWALQASTHEAQKLGAIEPPENP